MNDLPFRSRHLATPYLMYSILWCHVMSRMIGKAGVCFRILLGHVSHYCIVYRLLYRSALSLDSRYLGNSALSVHMHLFLLLGVTALLNYTVRRRNGFHSMRMTSIPFWVSIEQ
ncbi:hypothetical protein BDW75DRAFT_108699 [Aspergillus navahoensis]